MTASLNFVIYFVVWAMLSGRLNAFVSPFRTIATTAIATNTVQSSTGLNGKTTQKMRMSFVHDEMRPHAIKYHSRDQTSQGQQPAQVPFTQWNPTKVDFLQYLVDSLAVYDVLEPAVADHSVLCSVRTPGLERASALRADIQWLCQSDTTLTLPAPGSPGKAYAAYIHKLLQTNDVPGLVCHYYNTYFALTAGGLRIGQHLTNKLLEGKKLRFYSFDPPPLHLKGAVNHADNSGKSTTMYKNAGGTADSAEVSTRYDLADIVSTSIPPPLHDTPSTVPTENNYLASLKDTLRDKIDALAEQWTPEQRQQCCTETEKCFQFGNGLLAYLHGSGV